MAVRQHQCTICLESFKTPKLTPCHHSFCYKCLEDYVRANLRSGKFNCPICKRSVELPGEGVKAFQTNFYIETEETEVQFGQRPICKKHSGHEIQLKCQTCNVYMCFKCKAFDHDTHPSTSIAKVAAEIKSNLKVKQNLCDERLKNVSVCEQKCNILEKRLNEEEQAEIEAIEHQYSKLLNALDQEVIKMKDKVHIFYETSRKNNAVVTQKVREETKFYSSAKKDAVKLIDQGTDMEMIQRGPELERRMSKTPSKTDQFSLKMPVKKCYTSAGIELGALRSLIGTVENNEENKVYTQHLRGTVDINFLESVHILFMESLQGFRFVLRDAGQGLRTNLSYARKHLLKLLVALLIACMILVRIFS